MVSEQLRLKRRSQQEPSTKLLWKWEERYSEKSGGVKLKRGYSKEEGSTSQEGIERKCHWQMGKSCCTVKERRGDQMSSSKYITEVSYCRLAGIPNDLEEKGKSNIQKWQWMQSKHILHESRNKGIYLLSKDIYDCRLLEEERKAVGRMKKHEEKWGN